MKTSPQQRRAYEQSILTERELERCFASALSELSGIRSVADIGCGRGVVVEFADAKGIPAVGLDICLDHYVTLEGGSKLIPCNLEFLLKSERDYQEACNSLRSDLVVCLELAEHLDESVAAPLGSFLSRITNKVLLFSAATPGQGGSGHINEQTHRYWRSRIVVPYDEATTEKFRRTWSIIAPNAWWYGKNLMVFRW